MFTLFRARTMFLLFLSINFSGLAQAAFTQVVSFGDSLSDTGNVYAATGGATPGTPYAGGNFSNGPVWVEVLASQLGVANPSPNLMGGSNYAWGGARTTVDSSSPSTQTQLMTYLTDVGGVADSNALYTILTGGNDLQAFGIGGTTVAGLQADAQTVATFAQDLINAGAENILIVNVPDLGTAPISDGNEGLATSLTNFFNTELLTAIAGLDPTKVNLLDVFTVTQELVADPALFGLSNVTESCLAVTAGAGGAICDDFLFWDDLHPTAAGHQLIGDAAYAAVVPVPAAAWLFGSALIGLVGIKRKE